MFDTEDLRMETYHSNRIVRCPLKCHCRTMLDNLLDMWPRLHHYYICRRHICSQMDMWQIFRAARRLRCHIDSQMGMLQSFLMVDRHHLRRCTAIVLCIRCSHSCMHHCLDMYCLQIGMLYSLERCMPPDSLLLARRCLY